MRAVEMKTNSSCVRGQTKRNRIAKAAMLVFCFVLLASMLLASVSVHKDCAGACDICCTLAALRQGAEFIAAAIAVICFAKLLASGELTVCFCCANAAQTPVSLRTRLLN